LSHATDRDDAEGADDADGAAADRPEAIDQDVLDELERSVGDDRGFVREVIETWFEDAPRQIATLREGIATGDVEKTNRAAHTLKSTSASVGAMALSAMARELQTMTAPESTEAADLTEPEIGTLVDAVATEYERAHAELDSLIPAPNDP
jgi:HPt (histidine-containing phosphotransfer) domain-containing protein